jgi:hypothetical protein
MALLLAMVQVEEPVLEQELAQVLGVRRWNWNWNCSLGQLRKSKKNIKKKHESIIIIGYMHAAPAAFEAAAAVV